MSRFEIPIEARGALRARLRAQRRAFTGPARAEAQTRIQTHATSALNGARRVALYRAFDGEVETQALEATLTAEGIEVVFARVERGAQGLVFVRAEGWRKTRFDWRVRMTDGLRTFFDRSRSPRQVQGHRDPARRRRARCPM